MIVNLDKSPSMPQPLGKYSIEEHRRCGNFYFSLSNISLLLVNQWPAWEGKHCLPKKDITGHVLRKELARFRALNATLLDFLLRNQALIPEDWKSIRVCFWGTIYRANKDKRLFVKCLYFHYGRWRTEMVCLDKSFDAKSFALILAA